MPDYYKQVKTKLPVKDGHTNEYSLNVKNANVVLKGDFVTINQNSCQGCGKCAKVCPLGVIKLVDDKATPITELDCTLCRLCVNICRERAISLHYNWHNAISVAKRHAKRKSL